MYGTIARLHVKPGQIEAFKQLADGEPAIPGAVSVQVYQMDSDPDELQMVVAFADRQSYVANARDPEQHQRYLQMLEVLKSDPEWQDGEIIYHRAF